MQTGTSLVYGRSGSVDLNMSALFDSNIVIDLLAGHPPALAEAASHAEAAISRITWIEVLVGAPDEATLTSGNPSSVSSRWWSWTRKCAGKRSNYGGCIV
jgi:hypothetical protein